MKLHVKQIGYKAVENGYLLQYAQQTEGVATSGEFVFNTLGQLTARINDLDQEHDMKVKKFNEAASAAKENVEGKQ